jgi:hypothetical protein
MSLPALARGNSSRRRGRSLAIIGLLACGSFLVIAFGANRHSALEGAELRSSGTGGFAFIGESALPVYHDLNDEAGLNHFGLSKEDLPGVSVVPMRVREGDDASCLNLNRAQAPQVLGVDPHALMERNAFSFVATTLEKSVGSSWSLLGMDLGAQTLPAVADTSTVQWALGKKLGDTLEYRDERGDPFQVQIVGTLSNSILQGNLLISEEAFNEKFPSSSGYRMFLVDAPKQTSEKTRNLLSSALEDIGLDLVPAPGRLAEYNAVENTYLAIFQALGALGLLLGSAGLGVVVLRTALERRGELAVLRAVGFSASKIRYLVLSEHAWLLMMGLGCGIVSGLVTVIPTAMARGSQVPYFSLTVTLIALVASGFLWIWLATLFALRGPLLAALQNE